MQKNSGYERPTGIKTDAKPILALRPDEVAFWQEIYITGVRNYGPVACREYADQAVLDLRERTEGE